MKKKQKSFTGFMHSVVDQLMAEQRYGTAHVYACALNAFTKSVGGGEVFFGGLTRLSIKRFEHWLRSLESSWNTVSTYLRALRAVYNRAVDGEVIEGDYRLFRGVHTSIDAARKRALEAGEIQSLLDEEKVADAPQELKETQDSFHLMTLLGGMPFVDLVHLRKGDLNDGVISCHRRKTGSPLSVRLLPEAEKLLARYRNTDESSPYLLNFLSGHNEGEAEYKEYQSLLRRLNRNLSFLAAHCGVRAHVTTYTARHTWATSAKYCGVPVEVISQTLGHATTRTTEIYLKRFENDYIDKANKLTNLYLKTGRKIKESFF